MDRNRLGDETSPYLLQHRDNPVHWQPWSEATLAAAKAADKPILLSIGYAACHWCHVMAHESFENPQIAARMNELFVNIKVDREERPDLDQVYQHALALMGEQGGWPLTMFLTPDGEPFWGGTYFPPEQRWGRPGFAQVLEALSEAYRAKREDVAKNVTVLRDALQRLGQPQVRRRRFPPAARSDRRAAVARDRSDQWRHRDRAEIPAMRHLRAVVARLEAHPPAGLSRRRGQGARRDVPGRHLRSSRRRVCALFDRCALAGAAFREDAVRQRRTGRPVDPGLAGHEEPALSAADRRDDRLGRARDADLGRRVCQQPRCRQRARGRQVLRLVRGRNRRGAGRPRRPVQALLRCDPRGQLGRPHDPQPHQPRPPSPTMRPKPSWRYAARCCCRPAHRGCGRAGTTRCWPIGTG